MATEQQFCLRWNNHQSTLISVFEALLENSVLVDCTLAADGQQLKAHKVVLSACSPYLETLLSQHYDKHPIIILKDVKYAELKAILDYMYRGEVNISQEQLGTFLKAAESLQIKGLTDSRANSEKDSVQRQPRSTQQNAQQQPSAATSAIPLVNPRGYAANPLFSEKRKPGLVIPSHVIDNPPHSPLAAREGSISPTVRKRKKPNLPNQDVKNHQTMPDSCTVNVVNDCEDSNQTDGGSTEVQISSCTTQSRPDNVPDALSIKTEAIKTESTDDSMPMDEEGYDENNENENFNDDDTTMDLSAGPSRRFFGQGFNGKAHASIEGSIPESALCSADDTQNTSEDSAKLWNHAYLFQRRSMLQYTVNAESMNLGFRCQACGKVYNRKGNLGRHVRYECGKGPQFSCNLCEKRFFRREKLALHLKNHELFQQKSLEVVQGPGRISI